MDDFLKKKKKVSTSKYNYSFGDYYPGMHIGHKHCYVIQEGLPVPAQMGWLWNKDQHIPGLKHRKGWQPGAIGKTIANMMSFKSGKSCDNKEAKEKKKRRKSGRNDVCEEEEEPLEPKPTLKVHRKGDVFTIQVNPLKDLTEIRPNEDPYVDCDPLIFKIIKKRSPEEQAKKEARKLRRIKRQRDAEIRKALAEATEDICKCAYMDVFCNDLNAIDKVIETCPAFLEPGCVCRDESMSSLSSNATWDIEYTPPFGCFNLASRKKKSYIHVDTQYISADAGIVDTKKYKTKKCDMPKLKKQSKDNCPAGCA